MLAFIEALYLITVEKEGADSPGAILAEVSADDDYSMEMELQAYREALKLLTPEVDPALEPPVERSWNRAEGASGADTDSGPYANPLAEL
jgi:hypothetical protein